MPSQVVRSIQPVLLASFQALGLLIVLNADPANMLHILAWQRALPARLDTIQVEMDYHRAPFAMLDVIAPLPM